MRRVIYIAVGLTLVFVAVASFGHLLPASKLSPRQGKLNVILISIDSLRADHIGVYGYARNTSPNIDAWAKGALVFDNYFSSSYLTPIGEGSVHTGDYPIHNGVINFQSTFKGETQTLAEIVKAHGWQTAVFGSSPEFSQVDLRSAFSRGFDIYQTIATTTTLWENRSGDPVAQGVSWIKSATSSEPFFLWLPLGSVHWGYGQDFPHVFSDQNYSGPLRGYASLADQWREFGYFYNDQYYSTTTHQVIKTDASADAAYIINRYDDGILETDHMLGELFDYLKQSGLDSNTIVILQSEHGEEFGEHGYIGHYDILTQETHVPLIIKLPDMMGKKINALASGIDVMPTLLSLLHIQSPKVDGVDLVPFLTGATTTVPRNEVFFTRTPLWERIESHQYPLGDAFVAADNAAHFYDSGVQNARWELIHRTARVAIEKYSWWGWLTGTPVILPEYELYDLKADPGETHNIYTEHKSDPDVAQLQKNLTTWEAQMRTQLPGPTPPQEIQPYF